MARNLETERERDLQAIDKVIARMERQAQEFDSPQVTALFARELPRLLERRAKLLGLDVDSAQAANGTQPGSLAELEQKLALVARARQGAS